VREIVTLMVRLGALGFGGPAAHIAMMRDEVVRRRGWFSDAEFVEMVGATNLVPGPNSTEMAMHIGNIRAGGRGLIAAGLAFVLPAVVIVSTIAWAYTEHGASPALVDLRHGILPVVIAIVAQAVFSLGRTAVSGVASFATLIVATVLHVAGTPDLLILLAAGATWAVARPGGHRVRLAPVSFVLAIVASQPNLLRLGLLFLEVGSVVYGSGYVLVALLDERLVDDLGWLTSEQLLDAVAIGQITPGPVFTTATFIGWLTLGVWGAVVATIGVFGPSFAFVAVLDRIMRWIRRHAAATRFLRGVTLASLGLMAGALIDLIDVAIVDWFTASVAAAALVVLLATRLGATTIALAGVAIGVAKLSFG